MPEAPIYCLDTNVFMDWQVRYYPTDIFTSLPDRVEALLSAGRCLAPELVKEEIGAVGGADLQAWAKAHPGLFVPTAGHLAAALAIKNRFPGLNDPKAEYEEADAYVIGAIIILSE
jgi:hypothetical protein